MDFVLMTPQMETIVAIIVALCYIIVSKWLVSTVIVFMFDANRWNADWISYALVVVLTPLTLYYCFGYELTTLSFMVFGAYSVVWLLRRAYQRSFLLF